MKQVLGLGEIKNIVHGFYDATDSKMVEMPILMNQVHSADVLVIDEAPSYPPQVDALITKTPNLCLTVKTADCAPILIADMKNNIIAAIHAGWKGAFQGIIETTVLKMRELGGEVSYMVAGVGPHIQKESFKADEKMRALFPVTEHLFFEKTELEGVYHFDFHGYVLHRIQKSGITHIDSVLIDTYTDLDYNSYRRDPLDPARQYSMICLKK